MKTNYWHITKAGQILNITRWPCWLRRHDNLPLGCLARHLSKILFAIVLIAGSAAAQPQAEPASLAAQIKIAEVKLNQDKAKLEVERQRFRLQTAAGQWTKPMEKAHADKHNKLVEAIAEDNRVIAALNLKAFEIRQKHNPPSAKPSPPTPPDFERLADAIYKVEGGSAAKVPYGILSVKVANEAEARRVCLNTCRNNWNRWLAAGQPGAYLDFLADKYCPPTADPVGNRNWKKNVRAIYAKR